MFDVNRGNLLELLHLRRDDIPWLEAKLQSRLKLQAQWTSASIQNEILEIISSFAVERINQDVKRTLGTKIFIADILNAYIWGKCSTLMHHFENIPLMLIYARINVFDVISRVIPI